MYRLDQARVSVERVAAGRGDTLCINGKYHAGIFWMCLMNDGNVRFVLRLYVMYQICQTESSDFPVAIFRIFAGIANIYEFLAWKFPEKAARMGPGEL